LAITCLVTDGNGLPLAAALSAGQRHECRYAEPVLQAVRIRRRNGRVRPRAMAGDKGYIDSAHNDLDSAEYYSSVHSLFRRRSP
jgi:hypothetical protein